MKVYKLKYLSVILLIMIISCKKSFLDRYPKDALSETTFFNTATDLGTFVNRFYAVLPQWNYTHAITGTSNIYYDDNSDIMLYTNNISGNLNMASSAGAAPVTSAVWDNQFGNIRQVNYFLSHIDRVPTTAQASQYIGEGYFFRAWFYFDALQKFGDIPYITQALDVDDTALLYKPRDSRYLVAKGILQDLDSAIAKLQWKGGADATAGRVNKEAAMVMKSRVALYEGSWEYYHSKNSTPFKVAGHDGKNFLEMVEPAILPLIDHQGTNIFRSGGVFNEPYNQYFAQLDGSSVPGAFWYKVYNTNLVPTSHNFYQNVYDNGAAITKNFVDMYLDKNGLPRALSNLDFSTLDDMGQNLEPRFRQTIWTPDRGPAYQIPGRQSQSDRNLRYPCITSILDGNAYEPTGYRNWKGAIFDNAEYRHGNTDEMFIRYEEGLLNLAEAKAILGTINQGDIDKTVNLIRSRVDGPQMKLATVQSWPNSIYSSKLGFDPTESNIVNEIRRERTVELAFEGFRLDDLKRWAVFDKVINGYKPYGAAAEEFINYYNNKLYVADGYTAGTNFTLTLNKNYGLDPTGVYLNPLFASGQFSASGEGFWINKNRDYLNPIPTNQINLYKKKGITLTQNPGWN